MVKYRKGKSSPAKPSSRGQGWATGQYAGHNRFSVLDGYDTYVDVKEEGNKAMTKQLKVSKDNFGRQGGKRLGKGNGKGSDLKDNLSGLDRGQVSGSQGQEVTDWSDRDIAGNFSGEGVKGHIQANTEGNIALDNVTTSSIEKAVTR